MQIINGIKLYRSTEVTQILQHEFNYKTVVDHIRYKASSLDVYVEIGKSSYIPEEFVPYLALNLKTMKNKKELKEQIKVRKTEIEKILKTNI